MRIALIAATAAALSLAACATPQTYEPVVDPRTSSAPPEDYYRDLAECRQLAAQRDPAQAAAERGVAGAVAGAVVGGVIGSFSGDFGKGAAAGAAIGATGGAVSGAAEGEAQMKQIVVRCMQNRGWDVLSY